MTGSIEPFEIHVDDDVLDDLQARLRNTRWPARGGHFAALEQPELLLRDVRAFFRRFRGETREGSR